MIYISTRYVYMVYKGMDECYANSNSCANMPYASIYNHPETGWIYNTNILEGEESQNVCTFLLSSHTGISDVHCSCNNGNLFTCYPGETSAIRPTLYLSSSVKTTSGDGSIDSPYKLSL